MTSSRMKPSTPEPAVPRVVLGVTGGIAAYKAVELTRRLREAGFHVAPILTPDATRFVGPVTFSALASEPARVSLYDDTTTPIPHTYLGQTADLIVVAPATAHFIARYAMGLADDLLTATLLATRAPVLLCPAMHTEMWEQPSVQENLATLRRRGVLVMEPESGVLAGGDEGAGRLPEPAAIASLVEHILQKNDEGILSGRRVVISAGGTREPIDPVRVLSNRSSGRQGHALAEVAARLGATVQLVTTASLSLALDVRGDIEVLKVETAAEMSEAAAVADFGVLASTSKMKKQDGVPSLVLVPTLDILTTLVEKRRDGQIIVGFAAESDHVLENGLSKIRTKQCDLLVVNDVSKEGVGFDHATNEVFLIDRDEDIETISLRSKEAVSYEILSRVAALLTQGAQ